MSEAKLVVVRRATELLASSRTLEDLMAHAAAAFVPVLGDFAVIEVMLGGRPVRAGHVDRTIGDARLTVPLQHRGESFGAITAWFEPADRRHTDDDRQLATDLAMLASLAIAPARELRAKDELLAALGHELRHPLSPIVAALRLMEIQDGDRWQRERDAIDRQVRHMVRVVDDVLDVSRVARGKIALVRERIELAAIVDRALADNRIAIAQHDVVVDVPRGLELDADPVRLAQVVGNLLANAAAATPRGSRISVRAMARPGEIELSVSDRGAGLGTDRLRDAFAPVRDSDLALGMALVDSFVALHGGRTTVDSAGQGKGATYRIYLPRAEQHAAVAAVEAARTQLGPQGLRVLLVDDNRAAAEMLGELLRVLGHDVQLAPDGPAALATCDAFKPDIAILDVSLPGMDGYELARALRERGLPRRSLMAVTGYGHPADLDRSQAAGFDEHFVKPVDPAELGRMLASLVEA